MAEEDFYSTPQGFAAAAKAAAQNATAADPAVSVNERLRQWEFDRFLCRVFSDGPASEWVLKGGTGMLARVPDSRSTRDVDLAISGYSLEAALTDLRRLAEFDLQDHFRFVYVGHELIMVGDDQPYVDAYRVSFDCYLGSTRRSTIKVDLAVGTHMTGDVEVVAPAYRLPLSKPPIEHDYRLYPVVDQIADKVCATISIYSGSESTREKDLVDLVVLALTESIDAAQLTRAIDDERRRRGLDVFEGFKVPSTWGKPFTKMASRVPICDGYTIVSAATELIRGLLDPILSGTRTEGTWDPNSKSWK